MKAKIRPTEAKRHNYPFVVIPSAGSDRGWDVVFPDLPSSATWVADLIDLATEVPEYLSFIFDADEEAGLLSPAPSGYPEDETYSWAGQRHAEPDPDVTVKSTAEVAELLGITRQAVSHAARRHGIGRLVGTQRVFADADIQQLRSRPTVGRPSIGK